MFASDHTLRFEPNLDPDFANPEDFEAPANWALDDFEDIVPLRRETAEVLQ